MILFIESLNLKMSWDRHKTF